MKEKWVAVGYLVVISLLFGFIILGFFNIMAYFSMNDGVIVFASVITPSLIASVFLGFYFVKAILRTQKAFKKIEITTPIK
jgi:hypothetical protein